MAQTATPTGGVGRSGTGPVVQGDGRVTKLAHYVMDFDSTNYVTGGEDISAIWDDFTEVLHISVEQHDTNTAADQRLFAVDYTGKTLLVYDAVATEETASDQTVIKVGLLVYGYK